MGVAYPALAACAPLRSCESALAATPRLREDARVADHPPIPFRVLRAGLRAASRASSTFVARVLKTGAASTPAQAPAGRSHSGGDLEVVFDGRSTPARVGATLLETAKLAGFDLRSYCGGNCSCGTCRVEIVSGADMLSRLQPMERLVLGMAAERRGDRLACQAQVKGGRVVVKVPEWF